MTDSGGARTLVKEIVIGQTGRDVELAIATKPDQRDLPAVVVEDALVVGNLGYEGFNLWGTIKGHAIEIRYDEQQLKELYGIEASDWQQVRDCFVTLTPL